MSVSEKQSSLPNVYGLCLTLVAQCATTECWCLKRRAQSIPFLKTVQDRWLWLLDCLWILRDTCRELWWADVGRTMNVKVRSWELSNKWEEDEKKKPWYVERKHISLHQPSTTTIYDIWPNLLVTLLGHFCGTIAFPHHLARHRPTQDRAQCTWHSVAYVLDARMPTLGELEKGHRWGLFNDEKKRRDPDKRRSLGWGLGLDLELGRRELKKER